MKTPLSGIGFCFVVTVTLSGQYFTIEDIETGLTTYLKPATIGNLQWLGNTDRLLYSADSVIYSMNIDGDSISEILTLDELNGILTKQGETAVITIPETQAVSDSKITIRAGQQLIVFDTRNREHSIFSIPDTAGNIALNPNLQ